MNCTHFTIALFALAVSGWSQTNRGYYRSPAIYGQTIVFTAEGDLWSVGIQGGAARRLTTHPGEETRAAFSPDGKTIAYSANYEGPTEVYSIPASGGLPLRRTFDGNANMVGWTPDGKILFATRRYSTLPDTQLAIVDVENRVERVPLSQASQGCFDKTGANFFFTRQQFQGSYAKRYQGGTAQNLWKYSAGHEAVLLTADYLGTSKDAMWWNGRVYFLSDRDGTMNLWSMDENGKSLKQHTRHQGWDLKSPSLSQGKIVYQMGADLRVYDIASGSDSPVPIELASDFDHLREHWIKTPIEYTTSAHISPDGSSVVLTSRGRTFVAPLKGRFVDVEAHKPGRYREAQFTADGKSLLILSTESGEVELWKVPANGLGAGERLTTDGKVLRWQAIPSPDGKWVVHQDKDSQLWLLDIATKQHKRIAAAVDGNAANSEANFQDIRWSPDSRWLVYSQGLPNSLSQIMLYNIESGAHIPLTTDRYDSNWASWSPDGKWIYFVSDRALKSVVPAPWGSRQPEPYFDRINKIYMIALQKGLRSPFEPSDELHPDGKGEPAQPADPKPDAAKPADAVKPAPVKIDTDGIVARLQEAPLPPGNYSTLMVVGKRLCWIDRDSADPQKSALQCLEIGNKGDKPDTVMENVASFEVSADGKKMLIRRQNDLFLVDAAAKGASLRDAKVLADAQVDLKSWTFSVIPADEFREEFLDAWRLHRDYFYDKNMHGVNWTGMRDKYQELLPRVRDRQELNDLLSGMIGELSALHASVVGGDIRRGPDQIALAALGARLRRDRAAGGYVVEHIYASDPDRPDRRSPLAKPGVDIVEGDVLLAINGQTLLSIADPAEALRNQAGKQVLLRLQSKDKPEPREAVVKPLTSQQEADLRYAEWEYTRRLKVEQDSAGKIGYLHLRAMGPNDINQFTEEYTPVFTREGLIVDVRHNGGGNIDSWILEKLARKVWMFWQGRVGQPYWNMQQAFRGHLVVLCDERTGSDGEAFTEGFRRLGLGKVIGTRTWGGGVWLSASNVLADRGIATAAEYGVFGPEGKWLIEGHGVDPDIVVDNLPHATFEGQDAQLEAAIRYLKQMMQDKPVPQPKAPPYPDKSFKYSSETVMPVKTGGNLK